MTDARQQARELGEGAKGLLEDKAFDQAVRDLRKIWFDELMSSAHTTERKLELIAQLKALETFPAQLKTYMKRGAHA